MNQKFKIALLFLVLPLLAIAQQVSGTVTDAANNLPILGASVVVKGTSNGTATDFDGKYSLNNIPQGATLVFSYLGFATQEIEYTGQTIINAILDEDASQLDAIVLIGYGSTTKENVTAAQTTVSDDEFNTGAIVSAGQQLAGKAAGVQVVAASGSPGDGPVIRVRAGSTLSASQDPLYVVDGVPLDQGNANLNSLNPNDIESYTILKDASATAIYGNRASNGVVLITTKKGQLNSDWAVSYDAQFGVNRNFNQVDVLTADELRALATERGEDLSLLGDASTDWQNEIYQTGTTGIHNLSISKGWESTSLRLGLGQTNQAGTLIGSDYSRSTLNLALTQRALDNKLKLTYTAQGALENRGFADGGAIGSAIVFDPTRPVRSTDPNSSINGFFEFFNGGTPEVNAPANPVGLLESLDSQNDNHQIRMNLNANYKLPVDGLVFDGNAGFDYNEFDSFSIRTANSRAGFFDNGSRSFSYGLRRNTLLNGRLDYKKFLEAIDTDFEATVGSSYQDFTRETFSRNTIDGSFSDSNGDPIPLRFFPGDNRLVSFFGRLSFDIKDLIVLSGSISRDGSSRFSPEERFGTFGGASAAIKLTNLDFVQNSSFISQLKLRGGYGVTGQQEIGPDFAFIQVFTPGQLQSSIQLGDTFLPTIRPEGAQDLKWEETAQYNVGIDLGFFDDRLTGSVDAYYRETSDLLQFAPIAAGGLENFVLQNVGDTESRGLEIGVNAKLVRSENFNWNIGGNLTFNEIEITNLAGPNNNPVAVGGISGGVGNNIQEWAVGSDPSSFHVYRQVYDQNGNPLDGVFVDVNGDNVINEADRVRYKKANPDAYYGFTSNLNYKEFFMSFTLRGSAGLYNYNNVDSNSATFENIFNNPGNYYTNSTTDVLESQFTDPQLFSDYYVRKADFLKLDNATIGYTFLGDKVDIRTSITGTNLFTITDYDGLDPEVSGGIDNNLYPRSRTVVLGLGFTLK
ncbi:SusC/RagA family TonB-linked outer membrane protein [Nonlabens marinus]|uniref:SusC, outer membrane protein involved in starch binding n=1 Tax=Nonlabens marinus S1-08 TaxID=1454201 RepID=W8VW44_9FLAO|nr:SusC/RagA family TonB-linked outer membrane protein [Nonlabens marinus]BAO54427.1 SusC, outer membrane protein involved in starch binding [Nonlabens marinus S1-08]